MISAIPTKYNGIQFRSRLEAKWAAFFDLCRIRYQYEPVDLDGYIPDFIIDCQCGHVGCHRRCIVEVKGQFDWSRDIGKIEDAIKDTEYTDRYFVVGVPDFCDNGDLTVEAYNKPDSGSFGGGSIAWHAPHKTAVDTWKEACNVIQWKPK